MNSTFHTRRSHIRSRLVIVILCVAGSSGYICVATTSIRRAFFYSDNSWMAVVAVCAKLELHYIASAPVSTIKRILMRCTGCSIWCCVRCHVIIEIIHTAPRGTAIVYISEIPSGWTDSWISCIINFCTASKNCMWNEISAIIITWNFWKVVITHRTVSAGRLVFIVIIACPINNGRTV